MGIFKLSVLPDSLLLAGLQTTTIPSYPHTPISPKFVPEQVTESAILLLALIDNEKAA